MKFLEKRWYRRSPILLQDAAVSAHGLASRILRNGVEFRRILRDLERSQWSSEEEFQELQRAKLSKLIDHCYAKVPYYRDVMRERGLRPDDVRAPEDLTKLPFLTKETVRERSRDLVREDLGRRRVHAGVSSGSTGTPLTTLRDPYCVNFEQASIWRHWKAAGLQSGFRLAILRADPVVPLAQSEPPFWRHNRAGNQLILSSFHLSRERTSSYVAVLKRFRPAALQAIPSAAYFLAAEMLNIGETIDLQCVLTGSEPLYPSHRETIENAFGCKVFDFYGQSERVCFAMECPEHTGLHVTPEYGITELADPGWDAGGLREVVATGLNNWAMPLLRYRTGDLVEPGADECPCGRHMPLLGPIEVRIGGAILLPDGRFLPWVLLSLSVYGLTHVRKTQFIQESTDRLVVRIVPGDRFSGSDRETLVANIKRYVGEGVRVDVELVEDIPREKSGKYRFVISKVTTPYEEDRGGSS